MRSTIRARTSSADELAFADEYDYFALAAISASLFTWMALPITFTHDSVVVEMPRMSFFLILISLRGVMIACALGIDSIAL